MSQNLASIVPQCLKVGREEGELLSLGKRSFVVLFLFSLRDDGSVDLEDLGEFLFYLLPFVFGEFGHSANLLFPAVKHF